MELIELEWEGKGSFGNVIKGLNPKTREFYALKFISLLNEKKEFNQKQYDNTLKEIEILKKLACNNSPLILKFHNYVYDKNHNNIAI